ncbi:hypothetical protein [Pleomorphovibrio marinus]|uniref:hypothetical protein n=1 Tax=Pleomorphovibrio marinus TaxID=2164132 RepID=UPI000E0B7A75|nr:hypothetical protein [Pleomorphovibrio marinus]
MKDREVNMPLSLNTIPRDRPDLRMAELSSMRSQQSENQSKRDNKSYLQGWEKAIALAEVED